MSESAFSCYDSDRDVRTAIYLQGVALTVGEVVKLLDTLELTLDGVPLVMLDKFYCPECGGEVEERASVCYCWTCGNPDSFGEIPLPLSYGCCTSKPMANPNWRRRNA